MKEKIIIIIGSIIIACIIFINRYGCNEPGPEVDVPESFIIISTNGGR